MWAIGAGALLGNLLVIIWRSKRVFKGKNGCRDDPLRVQVFFIWNLAIADFMMGLYLIIIAAADKIYGDDYYVFSEVWRDSIYCKFAGFLTLVSNEASVFFIVVISVDQYIKVTCVATGRRITMTVAVWIAIALWSFAVVIGLIGILSASPDSDVYDLSDICIGLPFIKRPSDFTLVQGDVNNPLVNRTLPVKVPGGTKPAWYFSIVIFLCLNLICFIATSAFYIKVYKKVRKMAKEAAAEVVDGDNVNMVTTPEDLDPSKDADGEKNSIPGESKEKQFEYITNGAKPNENGNDMINEEETTIGVEVTEQKPAKSEHDDEGFGDETPPVKEESAEVSSEEQGEELKGHETMDGSNAKEEDANEAKRDEHIDEVKNDGESERKENTKDVLNDPKEENSDASHSISEIDDEEKDQDQDDVEVQETQSQTEDKKEKVESPEKQLSRMARKMGMIVVTDFLCWMPIIMIGILAQCGVSIPTEVYVWTVFLILPLNSSLNPYLYTFSTCCEQCCSTPEVHFSQLSSASIERRQMEADIILALTAQI